MNKRIALQADPDDPNILIAPRVGMPGTYKIELGPDGDTWCLMCEALDDKPWRFTDEQAARLNWLICGDCSDLIHMQLEMTTDHPAIAHIFAPAGDPDPMVMSIPSAD